jgi:HSP20 family molecular chaperone IbpA
MNNQKEYKAKQNKDNWPVQRVTPKARLYRLEEGWSLEVALPGVTQEQLSVEVEGDTLRLVAEQEHRRYERTFRLPQGQQLGEVEATLEVGLLTLKLSAQSPSRRQVEVRSA